MMFTLILRCNSFSLIFSEPYSTYKIWIKAYTLKNEGKSSEPLIVTTDVRAPGPPNVANLSCQNGNTMFLKWQRPTLYYRTVDVYHVFYKKEKDLDWNEQVVETVNNTINHMVSSPNYVLSLLRSIYFRDIFYFIFHLFLKMCYMAIVDCLRSGFCVF